MHSVLRSNKYLQGVATCCALFFFSSAALYASNHLSSPTGAQDRGANISDHWAFLDPNDNTQLVLILSTQGFIVSSEHFGEVIFDNNLRYRFVITRGNETSSNTFIDVTYSPGLGRLTTQTATISLPGGKIFTAPTTVADQNYTAPPQVVTTDPTTGAQFFAGAAADPFFLDDTGANRLVASSLQNPGHPDFHLLGERKGRNTYAGFNTLITAVRIPVALVSGGSNVIGVYVETQRQAVQHVSQDGSYENPEGAFRNINREGNPLVTNGLIPAFLKNAYQGSNPEEDAAGVFRQFLIQDLQNFGTSASNIATILDQIQVNGDILRINLTVPNTGPEGGNNPDGGFAHQGGRRLLDDVVDLTFTAIHNGIFATDFVDRPDKPLQNSFPFVALPYQPFRQGQNDHTMQ
jgi:uncharacterized protein DUF4331